MVVSVTPVAAVSRTVVSGLADQTRAALTSGALMSRRVGST